MTWPSTGLLDNFNRADESPLANGNWLGPTITGDSQLRILSNVASGVGTFRDSYWSATTFGPDSEVYATLPTITGDGSVAYVHLRIQQPGTSGPDGYSARYNEADTSIKYVRVDNAVYTTLGATETVNLAAGDKLGLEAIGSTLTAYYFQSSVWTGLSTRTDATYSGAGNLGLEHSGGNDNALTFDDFSGGTAVVGGSAVVSGTATAAMTEADVVAGGKTIILTLTGDTWIPE